MAYFVLLILLLNGFTCSPNDFTVNDMDDVLDKFLKDSDSFEFWNGDEILPSTLMVDPDSFESDEDVKWDEILSSVSLNPDILESEDKVNEKKSSDVGSNEIRMTSYLNSLLLTRYNQESGFFFARTIDWNYLDKSKLPEEYRELKLDIKDIETAISCGLSIDFIHFLRYDSIDLLDDEGESIEDRLRKRTRLENCHKKPKDGLINLSQQIKKKLRKKIKEQHPEVAHVYLRNYDIQNWPEGVDPSAGYWKKDEIKLINERFNELIFIDSAVMARNEISKKLAYYYLLERFQLESGYVGAKYIIWSLLDRSKLPEKYKNMIFSNETFRSSLSNGEYSEFIDYIHFRKFEFGQIFVPYESRGLNEGSNEAEAKQLGSEISGNLDLLEHSEMEIKANRIITFYTAIKY